ncbi:benenodin family lasso peptide [Novosphingobium sp.]|jgi:hypothetical protein
MEKHDDLIDLGTASVETLGPLGVISDENGKSPTAGLSDD